MKNSTTLLPMNLQFFGEDGNQGGEGVQSNSNAGASAEGDSSSQKEDGSNQGQQASGTSNSKTFTQEELTQRAAEEKKQGKNSILKLFGIKDDKTAKEEAEAYLKWKESQKTEAEKQQETAAKNAQDLAEANAKVQLAEAKLTIIQLQVKSDSIEDVLTIAMAKVTEDKTLEEVIKEMKEQDRYKSFFSDSQDSTNSNSTGSSAQRRNNGDLGNNIGKRLAEKRISSKNSNEGKKSSYFN